MVLRAMMLSLVAGVGLTGGLRAQSVLTKQQLAGIARLDSLTIPTPGEFFAAMDKAGQPNWTQLFSSQSAALTSSREQMALMLGVLVADGYIAVEAQDSQGVKNTGKDIINLAKKLNVSQGILGRGNSISDFAENNDWAVLREELEATQNEVKLAMAEQKDDSLVTLVTVGAWVRGTQVAAGYIAANYSPELAELLRQPSIVQFLLDQLAKLPEKNRATSQVVAVTGGLEAVLKIVSDDPGQPLNSEAVSTLSATMAGVVKMIAEVPKEES